MAEIPVHAKGSIMTCLAFLKMAGEYLKDATQEAGAPAYRALKLDKPSLHIRDAFNQLIAPLNMQEREELQKELVQAADVQAIIAIAIQMNPEGLEEFEKKGNEILERHGQKFT